MLSERRAMIVTDRQTNITKRHFRRWNVFDDMCRMGRRSLWSWFIV